MGWISPTSFEDPDSAWANEGNAYDNNTATTASTTANNHVLILILASATNSDKLQFWVNSGYTLTSTLWIFYDGDWHQVYSGVSAKGQWVEVAYAEGTKSISKIKYLGNNAPFTDRPVYLYELQVNEVAGGATYTKGSSLVNTMTEMLNSKMLFSACNRFPKLTTRRF